MVSECPESPVDVKSRRMMRYLGLRFTQLIMPIPNARPLVSTILDTFEGSPDAENIQPLQN